MRAISLFSGVGGLDLGLHNAGIRPVLFCEFDAWKRTILAHHWPEVPIHDDVRTLDDAPPADLVHGGFPCQDVSVAGRRAGLAGNRTGLFWDALRVVDAVQPRCVLLENVPGLLSSNGGRDFGVVVGELADRGYGVAWRILDAQHFGVPQRRRRVFVLAIAGDDPRAASDRAGAVLALREGERGNPPQSDEARQDAPAGATGGARGSRVADGVANTLKGQRGKSGGGLGPEETLVPFGRVADTLTSGSHPNSNRPGRRREDDTNLVPVAETQAQMRSAFLNAISAYSEERWAAGWADGVENFVRKEGGGWLLLAHACGGWPIGYEAEDGWDALTPDELSAVDIALQDANPDFKAIAFHLTQDPISGDIAPAMGKGNAAGCATIGVLASHEIAPTLTKSGGGQAQNADTTQQAYVAYRKSARVNADPDSAETWVDDGLANTLNRFDVGDVRTTHAVVTVSQNQRGELVETPTAHAMTRPGGKPGEGYAAVRIGHGVRRLTPRECERLMGWPDDWTAPPGVHAPDSRRYAACGDGVASPVAEWIGHRLVAELAP